MTVSYENILGLLFWCPNVLIPVKHVSGVRLLAYWTNMRHCERVFQVLVLIHALPSYECSSDCFISSLKLATIGF